MINDTTVTDKHLLFAYNIMSFFSEKVSDYCNELKRAVEIRGNITKNVPVLTNIDINWCICQDINGKQLHKFLLAEDDCKWKYEIKKSYIFGSSCINTLIATAT